jgi:NAD+ kinase
LKKLTKAIKRVGLIGNSEKVSCSGFITKAARIISQSGRQVCSDAVTAHMAGLKSRIYPDTTSLSKNVDLLLVFGGDGTMLRAASEIAGSRTPILGINIGGLGFLTAASAQEMPQALKQIFKGEFVVESRALIEVSGRCQGLRIENCALNDFVISRGIVSRLITLEVTINGETLTRYRCDGLIISSPTGSTAYALSAGGAVVHPAADVFQITPICPHTLSNRSVIVNLDSKIEVKVVSTKPETFLSADGQGIIEMAAGDAVTISRSRNSVRLIHLPGSSFFETLRRKLHWSGANV